jgi:hypothetical protein
MSELTEAELEEVDRLLRSLVLPYPIAGVREVALVRWRKPRGGQASYRWLGDVLSIEPFELSGRAADRSYALRMRIPAIAHELRHARQWRDWGPLLFFLNNLPVIQGLKMEKEAYAVEDAAMRRACWP